MTQLSRSALSASFNTNLPDNNSGLITPEILRTELVNTIDSVVFNNGDNPTHTGSNSISGSQDITGSQDISGSSSITGSLDVNGSGSFTGSLDVTGSSNVTGSLDVSGPIRGSGSLNIIGPAIISGSTSITGSTSLVGSTTVIGSLDRPFCDVTFNTTSLGFTLENGDSLTVIGKFTPNAYSSGFSSGFSSFTGSFVSETSTLILT